MLVEDLAAGRVDGDVMALVVLAEDVDLPDGGAVAVVVVEAVGDDGAGDGLQRLVGGLAVADLVGLDQGLGLGGVLGGVVVSVGVLVEDLAVAGVDGDVVVLVVLAEDVDLPDEGAVAVRVVEFGGSRGAGDGLEGLGGGLGLADLVGLDLRAVLGGVVQVALLLGELDRGLRGRAVVVREGGRGTRAADQRDSGGCGEDGGAGVSVRLALAFMGTFLRIVSRFRSVGGPVAPFRRSSQCRSEPEHSLKS